MPLIEVLPNSTAIATPGYAFVPDTRGLPQIAAQPIAGRKRAARNTGHVAGLGETTARQQNAILKHLAELDKDSARDVHIPIPARHKDHVVKGTSKKMTSNVRRILTSQKTFANHLADEEAAIAQQAQNHTHTASKPTLQHKPSSTMSKVTPSTSAPEGRDPAMEEANVDPLLRVYIPEAPTAEVMEALTSAPALSYNASRAVMSASDARPPRHFCDICGYWGTIKCLKCGTRVCGLECKTTHDDGRCLKFYT